MAWRALLCCLLAEVATAETASCSPSEDEETAQRTSFVQMAKHLEKHLESHEAALPGVCLRSLSWEIYRKPIQEVLKDHPNYDGWCIYGIMGELFSKCAVAREVRQLVPFTDVIQKKESPMHLGRTQRFVLEGSEVNVDRMHVLDDLYCHVNGWYELSSEAASNYSYVEEASKKYCQSLEEKVPGYRTMSLADVTKISGENEDWLASLRQDLVHLPQKVSNGLLALGAAKCLMSGTGSAAICDMAHCAKKKEAKLMLQQKKLG